MTVKNEVELAVLTKEQAEALEKARAEHGESEAIETHIHGGYDGWFFPYTALNDLDADTFIRALYVGYTVEKTQEEREADVKEYYDALAFGSGRSAVVCTLGFLGIHIEGVTKR